RQQPGVLFTDFNACNQWEAGLERADSIRCPVLFVLGQRDAMTPVRAARALIDRCCAAASRAAAPAPQVLEIADCGHAILSERPDVLLFALRDFLPASHPATLHR